VGQAVRALPHDAEDDDMKLSGRALAMALVAVVAVAAYPAWMFFSPKGLPANLASGNGRIEAVEIDIATKASGRVIEVMADEGDFVSAGQVLATMDIAVLQAQRREAEAQLQQARISIDTAKSQITQREAEKTAAEAVVAQREAELASAGQHLSRSEELAPRGAAPIQRLDDDRATFQGARAAVAVAKAQVAAAEATLNTARSEVVRTISTVEAAQATIERIQADIDDSTLRSPRDGRVQYRVAQPGEVLSAGGRVLNMVDLSDVYMTFFLPTEAAGRVALGTDVRLVLDAAPQYVIPATASFVADVAQFTPKTVETAEERQKLMFRVKARIAPELLKKYIRDVKTGLPGMAYVRLDPRIDWPAELQVRLPQ
jgi:HlyD family secretion protein